MLIISESSPHILESIDAALFRTPLWIYALLLKVGYKHGWATVVWCNYGTINTHYAPNDPGNSLIHTGNTTSNHLESQGALEKTS